MKKNSFYKLLWCSLLTPYVLYSGNIGSTNTPAQISTITGTSQSGQQTTKNVTAFLKAIVENAKILVVQIRTEYINPTLKKSCDDAIKNIETQQNSLKTVSPNTCTLIEPYTSIIIQEYKNYENSLNNSSLFGEEYNTKNADNAFQYLITAIKQITESNSEAYTQEQQKNIAQALTQASEIQKKALDTINSIQVKLDKGMLTTIKAAKLIGKERYFIDNAQKKLEETINEATENVTNDEEESSYLNQALQSAYNFGASVPVKIGLEKEYTTEEREIARAIVQELQNAKDQESLRYMVIKDTAERSGKSLNKTTSNKHNKIIKELDNEIYKQQLITGEATSLGKKIFWGTAALAGTALAAYLINKSYNYFTLDAIQQEKNLAKPIVTPAATTTTAPIATATTAPIAPTTAVAQTPSVSTPVQQAPTVQAQVPPTTITPPATVAQTPVQQAPTVQAPTKAVPSATITPTTPKLQTPIVAPAQEQEGWLARQYNSWTKATPNVENITTTPPAQIPTSSVAQPEPEHGNTGTHYFNQNLKGLSNQKNRAKIFNNLPKQPIAPAQEQKGWLARQYDSWTKATPSVENITTIEHPF